ncbi:MAG: hypothetical protein ABIS39_03280 [Sphingomicrobium sp.]
MSLILLLLAAAAVWIIAAPGVRFLPEFARLLTAPRIERGPFNFFSGRSYVSGAFQGREAAVRLQLKRSRYGQGYLVLALRLEGLAALDEAGGGASIDAHVHDAAGRQAISMFLRHGLLLSVEEGWLKALWQPQGFIIFPGRFSADKWRQVLENLATLAMSLERAS